MKTKTIPAENVLAAHEQAAAEIGELRRKGKPCHLEEHVDDGGHHVDVIEDRGEKRESARHAESD